MADRLTRFLPIMAVLALVPVLVAGPAAAQAASGEASLSQQAPRADTGSAPDGFSDLAQRLMPAVVNITTRQTVAPEGLPEFPEGSPLERFNPFFGRDEEGYRQQGSLGSGFVISPEGHVVTNNHVIDGADEINAVFADGTTLRAELVGTDPDTDIAVLKLASETPLPFVDFADSDTAEVGDWVIAIGNPFGFGGSVSAGIISARNRETGGRYDDFIQTDAAINRGNSGGPLFNLDGDVVGVNTAIISPTGGSIGIGFSIPANMAKTITSQLIEHGELRRGWLGVTVQGVDPDLAAAYGLDGDDGVIITGFSEGGPAEAAGFQVGDLIRVFDGKPVQDVRSLTRIVAESDVGATVAVDVVRDGVRRTVDVTLGELDTGRSQDDEAPEPDVTLTDNPIGADLVPLTADERRRYSVPSDVSGVLVNAVSPRGPAFGKLEKGDVILELGFQSVSSVAEAADAIDEARQTPDRPLLVRVWRRGAVAFFPIRLEAGS